MNITRELIEKIVKDKNITTVNELLIHFDHEEFYELVNDKSRELENGILRFRYEDRKERLNLFKKELFDLMVSKGRLLDRDKCGIIDNNEEKEYICHYYSECEHQKHSSRSYIIICAWEHAEDCKYCKLGENIWGDILWLNLNHVKIVNGVVVNILVI